jgi:SNF2 family DNA or RNA helicase
VQGILEGVYEWDETRKQEDGFILELRREFKRDKLKKLLIQHRLSHAGVRCVKLDGSMSVEARDRVINAFRDDAAITVFLISLKAGGSGLNLMAADTVIIYDPWWNPAVESQAVDRAHRIGQNRTVSVYRLVTENSVEQKIMELKARKSKLVDALINENGLSTVNLSKSDLESLFSPLPEPNEA